MTTTTTTKTTNPVIRRANSNDLPGIETLLTASELPTDGVRDALPGFLVAALGDEIVGVAGLEVCCDNALLRSVAVAPQWRSAGIGRTLVNRVIADAESRGIRGLYLLTNTAERYFPSFGFREIQRAEVPADVQQASEFLTCCCSGATVMSRVMEKSGA